MANILPETEATEFEGRFYSNPQVGIDETNSFIDNFRNTQQANTNQISAETQALGTSVPSNLGGLTGGTGYWTSRYQTPATNQLTQDLRATAQATALNEVLANEQAKWKKRYQDAYRAYQKREYDKANTPTTVTGDVDETTSELHGEGTLTLSAEDLAEGGAFIVDPASGNIIGEGFMGNNPRYINDKGTYKKAGTPTKTQPIGSDLSMVQLNVGTSGTMGNPLDLFKQAAGDKWNKITSAGFSGR